MNKEKRQDTIKKTFKNNPFLTDKDMSEIMGVSIQTVRLDRLELNIPELRERIKEVAKGVYGRVRTLERTELIGELVELKVGKKGVSILRITPNMTLHKTKVARGHYLFAQANSLAVALIDSEIALTGTAKSSFKRPVFKDEKIVARAAITQNKGNKYVVRVSSTVKGETVYEGKFLIFAFKEGVPPL